jgi:hypothetical protein
MYVSTVRLAGGSEVSGVWGPSLAAAAEAGITFNPAMNWDMTDIRPGQTRTFRLAAYGPRGAVVRIAYAMDASQRQPGGLNPTEVPGANIVAWLNQVNTECTGEIGAPPR